MTEYENGYSLELKEKLICRFCLTQEDPLSNIYSTKNQQNQHASLSLQIMACVSIEVFADDEMPSTICERCRALMSYCYQFKQMCRRADTLLKQVPLTGVWPKKLEHPKYPILQTMVPVLGSKTSPVTAQTLKRKLPQSITISSPSKKATSSTVNFESIPIEDMIVEFADESIGEEMLSSVNNLPKILNNQPTPMKILNNQSSIKSGEPMIRCSQVVKADSDGQIEIISEMIESEGIDQNSEVETNVFPCNFCERSFPLRQLLDIHVANHVRDRKYQCNVCSKGFFSKYDLGKHVLIHTGEKPFKCVVCEKAFSRSTLLRRHEKIHTDQPKFICGFEQCERTFLSKDEWEKHTQNHEKKRPFECEICGKSFAFKQGLERHEVVHSTNQPFKCEHCNQGFSTQGKLARHLTSHAGRRAYPCRVCKKSYLLSHHLSRHMRSHKDHQQSTHKCFECNETFSQKEDLIQHTVVHATENLECPLCKEQFEHADDVAEHIRLHTESEQFACEFCDLIFLTESALHDHSDSQHMEEIELYETDESVNRIQELDSKKETEGIEYTEEPLIDEDSVLYEEEDILESKSEIVSAVRKNAKSIRVIKQEKIESPSVNSSMPSGKVSIKSESQEKTKTPKMNEKLPTLENAKPASTRPTRTSIRDVESPKSKNGSGSSSTKSNRSDVVNKSTTSVSLNKFLTVKSKTTTAPNSTLPQQNYKKNVNDKTTLNKEDKRVGMKIGDKLVKVQQIRMTKAQVDALQKEGKIEMRNGQMIIKKPPLTPKKK